MKLGPNSKPHRNETGYVCEMKCKLGGHVVIYDRNAPGIGIDGDNRWVVMHEPSSLHVTVGSMAHARSVMKGVAKARTIEDANGHAQIIPQPGDGVTSTDDDGAEETVKRQERMRRDAAYTPAMRDADLETFMSDPENAPSEAGIAARRRLFAS